MDEISAPRRWGWWAVLLILGGAVLAGAWYAHFKLAYERAEVLAQESAKSYALMSRHILKESERLIAHSAQAHLLYDEESDTIERLLAQHHRHTPWLLDLLILDETGRIVLWSGEGVPPDVSDRDYFRALKAGTHRRFVSPPTLSRVHEETWFFALSVGVYDSDDRLVGAGVAIFDTDKLHQSFEGLFERGLRSASLLHTDGRFILRHPLEKTPWTGRPSSSLAAIDFHSDPLLAQRFFIASADDGRPRTIALEPIKGYDLIAAGTVDMTPTRQSALLLAGGAFLVWLLAALGSGWFIRRLHAGEVRSRQHREAHTKTLQQIEHISRNLPGMLYQLERDSTGHTRLSYASQAAWKVCGLSAQALSQEGGRFLALIHPDDRARVEETIARSADQLTLWHTEYRILTPESHTRWVEGRATPQRTEEGGTLWHGYLVDISERKRMEAQIKTLNETLRQEVESELKARIKSERLYAAIFEHSPEGVLLLDCQGRFIHANQSAAKMIETTPKALLGRTLLDLSLPIQPETGLFSDRILEQVFGRVRDGRTEQFEWVCRSEQGHEVELEILLAPFEGEASEQMLMMWRDISEIKQLRDERQMQQAVLMQQTKLAELGSMIGAIAHQWKQPLNAIGLIAQDIGDTRHFDELSIEECDRLVDKILDQVRFMSRTVDDFRNFYKPNTREEPFDLKEEIEQIVNLLSAQLSRHDVAIGLDLKPHLRVMGKAGEFRQVVLNIVNNAKEVLLERSHKAPEITITLTEASGWALLRFEDNGGGIAEHLLPDKLFIPFTTTKGEKGTGIGLSLSATILQRMHGTIEAANTQEGACFTIKLPLYKGGE